MNWFDLHCRCLAEPQLIVHLGAGRGTELSFYQRLESSRVLLVEPQPDLAAGLKNATSSMTNIEVLQAAIASKSGSATLRRLSLQELSSIRQPTGLLDLFPGLIETASITVETVSLSDLFDRYELDRSGDNWLVIDAPGVETDVVPALAGGDLARSFSHIFLSAGSQPLFMGSSSSEHLLEMLAKLGYESFGAPADADQDFPRIHLELNPAALEVMSLRAELSAQASGMKARDEAIDALQSKLTDCQKYRDEFRASADRANTKINVLNDQVAKLSASASAREDERAKQLIDTASLKAASEEKDRRITELESELLALTEAHTKLAVVADEARADLAISIRQNSLRETDFTDLQERYAAAIELRDKQHDLLANLRQRLQSAAQYLQQLEADKRIADEGDDNQKLFTVHATKVQKRRKGRKGGKRRSGV